MHNIYDIGIKRVITCVTDFGKGRALWFISVSICRVNGLHGYSQNGMVACELLWV